MIRVQKTFDQLIKLLEAKASVSPLAAKCLADCDGELAYTPADTDAAGTSPQVLAQLFLHNATDASTNLAPKLNASPHMRLYLSYIDTDNGGYTLVTDAQLTDLVGIVPTAKTLTEIRRDYFIQKETLERIGEKPVYDYEQKENTFVNRKLVV